MNLERAVTPHTRLGGHLMQGHVDGVGRILGRSPGEHWEVVRIALPPELARYVVEKGSIAVDGVSLTVSAVSAADVHEPWFEVSLIPTTLRETTLGARSPGGARQPGGRRDRQVRGATAGGLAMTSPLGRLDTIETAIAAIKSGRPVVVIDDEDRENEGDLIFASELATPELVAFMVRYTSGYICVAVTEADADRLDLPPMFRVNQDRHGTAYTVTVDAREGITTGISASDRATTIRTLAAADTTAHDLTRPGHIVPLRAKDGGVLRRPGHTEAAVDLAVLAGLRPSGALCEIVSEKDPTGMARGEELRVFADEHDLVMISIADLIAYRKRFDKLVERVAEATVPLAPGVFTAVGYRSSYDEREHVAFVYGDIGDGEDVLVRVHSECLTGDVFGSLRCDCGPQLQAALGRRGPGGARHRALHPRARGPGDRPAAQAAGLPAAGPRRGHRRRQPRPRPARRRPRLRHRRADPGRPRRAHHAAADQQPGQARRPGGLRPEGPRPRAAAEPRHRREPRPTCAPSATGWATCSTSSSRRPRRVRRTPRRAGVRRPHPGERAPARRRAALVSGSGAPVVEPVDAAGLTLGIVATTWHAEITDQLLARAVEAAKASGVPDPPWCARPARSSCRSSPRR